MKRRQAVAALGVLVGVAGPLAASRAQVQGDAQTLRSLAVLDFELIDEQNNPLTKAAQEVRLRNATAQLQRELAERRLYRVVDPQPSQALQRTLRDQQAFLYRCDDCADQVGRQLGVDLVMATWVQKVAFSKSVDMRGNDDVSWMRAVSYLVRDMADRRARDPRYAAG